MKKKDVMAELRLSGKVSIERQVQRLTSGEASISVAQK